MANVNQSNLQFSLLEMEQDNLLLIATVYNFMQLKKCKKQRKHSWWLHDINWNWLQHNLVKETERGEIPTVLQVDQRIYNPAKLFRKHLPLTSYSGFSISVLRSWSMDCYMEVGWQGCFPKWIKVGVICSVLPPLVIYLCTMYMCLLLSKVCYVKEEGSQFDYHTGWPNPTLLHWSHMQHLDIWKCSHLLYAFLFCGSYSGTGILA